MAIDGYFPRITPPKKYDNYRMGDGLGMIITLADGKKVAYLYDGFQGGEPTDELIEWFESNGITVIDICTVSHAHGDHYGGPRRIVESGKLKINQILCYHPDSLKHGVDNTSNGRSVAKDIDNMYEFIRAVQAKGTKVNFIDHGSVVKVGDISFKVYRKQPRSFTEEDEGNGWAFGNNGSLVLCSPELEIVLPGDGPDELEDALDYFNQPIVAMSVSHHGGSCNRPNAKAAKARGCVLAWESCVEKNGVGTSDHTMYGSRRVKEQGIPVWMQNYPMTFHAEKGKITFMQNGKTVTAKVPYQGAEVKIEPGWVKNAKGWWYRYKDGSWPADCTVDLRWSQGVDTFCFNKRGYMVTGWQKIDNTWYFFDEKSGAMMKGWILWDGSWFYLDPETGAMCHTCWIDYKKKRCYLEPSGRALRNCIRTIDGKTYQFDDGCYATELAGDMLFTKAVGKLNEVGTTRLQFVLDIANYVRKYAPQYDIKVYSPIIAQAIHESGWGESKLSAKYHNYFGLKCGTKWTGKSVNMKTQEEYSAGTLSTISANFRAYDSMEEGVKGYFDFIQLPRYANLKGVTSPRQYLQNIKDDGYATGSQYVDHVMNTLNLYNLTQFDGEVPVAKQPAPQGQREAIVSEAISHIGVKEGTVLHHKIIDRYNSRKPLPRGYAVKYTDAWCATFISYLAIVMGYTDIIPVECGCPQMITLAKQMGIWVEDDSYVPKPGDIVLYDWQDSGSGDNTGNPDHIGIVEKVVGSTETIIEGNYQDSVKRRELAVNGRYIRGYIVPKYK